MYVGNKRRKSAIRLLALLLAVIVCAFPQDASAAGWITFKDDWNGKLQQLSDYMVADSRNQDGSLTVTVRTRFYHHGTLGKIKWATDKIIYVDGTETAKIYSDRNASAGPGGHLAQQVSFRVRGGGSHRITSVEVPFNRPDTQAGWDFTITLPYLVVFKSGYGNNEVLKRQEVMPGGSAIAPQVNREGYNFTGWDKNFSNVHSDLTVTAQWKKKMCRVRFLTGYGNDDVIKTQMVEWGGDATAPPDPRRKGWRFTGWDRGYTNVKSDIDVRARWAPDGRIRYSRRWRAPIHAKWPDARDSRVRRPRPRSTRAEGRPAPPGGPAGSPTPHAPCHGTAATCPPGLSTSTATTSSRSASPRRRTAHRPREPSSPRPAGRGSTTRSYRRRAPSDMDADSPSPSPTDA